MEMDVAVFLEPALVVLVRVEIVDNDVKLATREGGNDAVQVSRPGIFTSGLSQNRARDSRLTRLPSDRKSTRLNSSHLGISYAVFCLKKKNKTNDLKLYKPREY